MKLPLDAPKFKLAAVSVPRNACEARERARDRVRVDVGVRRANAERRIPRLCRALVHEYENSRREVGLHLPK